MLTYGSRTSHPPRLTPRTLVLLVPQGKSTLEILRALMGRAEVSSTGAPYLVGSALTLTLAVSTRKISAAQRCMVVRECREKEQKQSRSCTWRCRTRDYVRESECSVGLEEVSAVLFELCVASTCKY